MLNRQRRERPLRTKAVAEGKRIKRTRFGWTRHLYRRSCSSVCRDALFSLKPIDDPLLMIRAYIDQNCVGCGNCGEVAEAAILCPSFISGIIRTHALGQNKINS